LDSQDENSFGTHLKNFFCLKKILQEINQNSERKKNLLFLFEFLFEKLNKSSKRWRLERSNFSEKNYYENFIDKIVEYFWVLLS